MSEWWTYSLTSFLLFSPRTYYRLFELTNADVWPLQFVALTLGIAIAYLIWHPRAWSGRAIATILAALWLFVAWAYLLERYDTINWAARYFAIAFALQAAVHHAADAPRGVADPRELDALVHRQFRGRRPRHRRRRLEGERADVEAPQRALG